MNWSDDENVVMNQPSRDMPSSESDEEDYMPVVMKSTNIYVCESPDKKEVNKKNKKQKNKKNDTLLFFNTNIKTERKFNPRIPPPTKYKNNL